METKALHSLNDSLENWKKTSQLTLIVPRCRVTKKKQGFAIQLGG